MCPLDILLASSCWSSESPGPSGGGKLNFPTPPIRLAEKPGKPSEESQSYRLFPHHPFRTTADTVAAFFETMNVGIFTIQGTRFLLEIGPRAIL